jgi:hypothetical protein
VSFCTARYFDACFVSVLLQVAQGDSGYDADDVVGVGDGGSVYHGRAVHGGGVQLVMLR